MIKTTAKRVLVAIVAALLTGFMLGLVIGKTSCSRSAEPTVSVSELRETEHDPKPEPEPEPEPEPVEAINQDEPDLKSLGVFTVTAYCACDECCGKSDGITATGVKAEAGKTVAVDPSIIPYGSLIMIDGVSYIAQDTMAQSIKNRYAGRIIDIYFENHVAALEYGTQQHEVHILVTKSY